MTITLNYTEPIINQLYQPNINSSSANLYEGFCRFCATINASVMGAILPMNINVVKISLPNVVACSDKPDVNPTVPRAEAVSNQTFIKGCWFSVIERRMLVINAQDIANMPIDIEIFI